MSIFSRADGSAPSVNQKQQRRGLHALTILLFLLSAQPLWAREVLTIAVASNFKTTLALLSDEFRAERALDIRIVSASTGVLYAQIASGAPFDVFLAADADRPGTLAREHLGVAETRFTFALGQLVLWIPGQDNVSAASLSHLQGKLSIASPETAPYGLAARQYLQRIGLWESLKDQLVYGKNITQAFQYVSSGNAQAGFVAWSILKEHQGSHGVSADFWIIPPGEYSPIEQQAIRLTHATNPELADEFCEFLKSDTARGIMTSNGYSLPERMDNR